MKQSTLFIGQTLCDGWHYLHFQDTFFFPLLLLSHITLRRVHGLKILSTFVLKPFFSTMQPVIPLPTTLLALGNFFTRSCFTLMDCIVQVYDIAWFTYPDHCNYVLRFSFPVKTSSVSKSPKTQMRTTSTFLLALLC